MMREAPDAGNRRSPATESANATAKRGFEDATGRRSAADDDLDRVR
jgi:hypothetical protein